MKYVLKDFIFTNIFFPYISGLFVYL